LWKPISSVLKLIRLPVKNAFAVGITAKALGRINSTLKFVSGVSWLLKFNLADRKYSYFVRRKEQLK